MIITIDNLEIDVRDELNMVARFAIGRVVAEKGDSPALGILLNQELIPIMVKSVKKNGIEMRGSGQWLLENATDIQEVTRHIEALVLELMRPKLEGLRDDLENGQNSGQEKSRSKPSKSNTA
jgi:hypothetical protein